MRVKTRAAANTAGENRFFTGKPCLRGHVCERYVSSGLCVECNAARAQTYRKNGGNVKFVAYIHPDDVDALRARVAELKRERR